ncbi:CLUMA_CG014285, isoform A [Clunio marinus]|uniref:CLUMA_CG014285, isoform A n=1 Tax=Clunio marinus TaxID=568069 RepID=A0A1J1IPM4_9DIPT|nr:CLUMA_CG014285, isoform A [Clunio marinus]
MIENTTTEKQKQSDNEPKITLVNERKILNLTRHETKEIFDLRLTSRTFLLFGVFRLKTCDFFNRCFLRIVCEMETKKVSDDEGLVEIYAGKNGNQGSENDDDSDTNDSVHLPATSPISSSSGVFSCGSASSSNFASKPTTPTNLQLTDKSDDENLSPTNNNRNANEVIALKDNAEEGIGALVITKRCDNEEIDSDNKNNRYSSSMGKASTSKSVKIRLKHRHTRKSFDDEIVIYESDSSLQIDPRRRNVHTMYSNRTTHQNTNRDAISRRKSEENSTQPSNQIVSILKRKDSSTSSNASLVTFSPNVIDMEPTTSSRRTTHRQGILKKRSSLDESLRFSRSHSPSSASSESEKGCLVKNNRRRNSSEEINNHGILKQKSYDSSGGGSAAGYSSGIGGSSGGYNTPNSSSSTGVQGILKKPSLTPSDHNEQPTKHVSISEAVILAAAELCKDMIIIDDIQSESSYIKPILKVESDHSQPERRPKPILKKNHSSENEEIRSILKSRKSSREESLQDDL